MLTTLLPSTIPFKLFAWTSPSAPLRAISSSHHPNRKSRAMSLNHGVKAFSRTVQPRMSLTAFFGHEYSLGSSNISWSSFLLTYL